MQVLDGVPRCYGAISGPLEWIGILRNDMKSFSYLDAETLHFT